MCKQDIAADAGLFSILDEYAVAPDEIDLDFVLADNQVVHQKSEQGGVS